MIRSMNLKFKYGECNSTNENAHEKQGHVWGSICNCWNTLIIMNVRSQKGKLGNALEIQGRKPGESEAGREAFFCFVIFADMYTLSQGQAPAVLCTLSWTCTPSSYGEVRRWDDRASKALDFWLAAAPDPGVVGAT